MNFKNYLASVLIEELTFEERKAHTVKQMLTFAQTPYYDLISVTLMLSLHTVTLFDGIDTSLKIVVSNFDIAIFIYSKVITFFGETDFCQF